MTLFIADSDDRVRQRLASIAAGVGGISVVGEAGDVGTAIEGIKRARPESVVTTLPMPGGNGLKILSAAKSTNPSVVTIVLSQAVCSECEHVCFAKGADYFYEKSWEVKKLVTTLVLLSHRYDQGGAGPALRPDGVSPPDLLFLSKQAEAFSSHVSAACQRIQAPSTIGSNECFLVGGAVPITAG